MTVTILDARRRWFIQKAEHLEARAPKPFRREESLIGVGMSRHPEDNLQRFAGRNREGRIGSERGTQFDEHFDEQVKQAQSMPGNLDLGVGPSMLQVALQGANDGVTFGLLGLPG